MILIQLNRLADASGLPSPDDGKDVEEQIKEAERQANKLMHKLGLSR